MPDFHERWSARECADADLPVAPVRPRGRHKRLALARLVTHKLANPGRPAAQASAPASIDTMKIRLKVNGHVLTARLLDNAAATAFLSLLPVTLTLEDYAFTEKVSPLPGKLPTVGAPSGSKPAAGDITYYAPWGSLAIFYRDFGYANGLVKLARVESGLETLAVGGPVEVTIERDEG